MPLNVTMNEPWPRVIRRETDGNVVASSANAYDITTHWIVKVILGATCNTDDVESVTMEMERVLLILLD